MSCAPSKGVLLNKKKILINVTVLNNDLIKLYY